MTDDFSNIVRCTQFCHTTSCLLSLVVFNNRKVLRPLFDGMILLSVCTAGARISAVPVPPTPKHCCFCYCLLCHCVSKSTKSSSPLLPMLRYSGRGYIRLYCRSPLVRVLPNNLGMGMDERRITDFQPIIGAGVFGLQSNGSPVITLLVSDVVSKQSYIQIPPYLTKIVVQIYLKSFSNPSQISLA